MRKTFAAVFAGMFVVAVGAGSAVAGEVKGPLGVGGPTPIGTHAVVAASECSFNGLNDLQQGQTTERTQNYGTNIQLGLDPAVTGFPGTGCNGSGKTPPGLAG